MHMVFRPQKWRRPHQPHPGTRCSRYGCSLPGLTRLTGNQCGGTGGATTTRLAEQRVAPLYRSGREIQPLGKKKSSFLNDLSCCRVHALCGSGLVSRKAATRPQRLVRWCLWPGVALRPFRDTRPLPQGRVDINKLSDADALIAQEVDERILVQHLHAKVIGLDKLRSCTRPGHHAVRLG